MRVEECDVLVIGAGIAGSIAALQASDLKASVTLLSTGGPCASEWAQGGIVYKGSGDPKALIHDIFEAGAHKNYLPAVEMVANLGPEAVERWLLKRAGVVFDNLATGEAHLNREAAHSSPRILHSKDSTGRAILTKLHDELCGAKSIQQTRGVLVDLITTHVHDSRPEKQFSAARVCGAYVFDPEKKEVYPLVARAVVLATGGFSGLYQHSTGPTTSSRGDGLSAAHRVGARTHHLEFVQFHPTALYLEDEPRWLLTEALRGAGAKLLNAAEKSFVDEMAPRDVVARAIHDELLKTGGTHVWLDLRHLQDFHQQFPGVHARLQSKGFDAQNQLIPVVPAAHYTVGGVWTNLDGATSVPGLYAAGEISCTGLHGANRLASTSLLEGLIFGERAAKSASDFAKKNELDFKPRPWRAEKGVVDPALLQQDWHLLRQTMWNYVGLVRSERRLRRAERILVELRLEVESFYKQSLLSEELIGLRNGVLVANLVLYAALRNRHSVGTHYLRSDY